ncbi:Ras GTPase activation domain-containing protein [Achlya hypogyna]|uniref:Ras GTPase activation domain-containing protein n=1 Tax=Achlya hypogyna TaxID=1202772 RepID=A0A1V9Z103_ACHHY|nr:Ras GTPase activation domain-containing protein [Achlya hypogyna]
MDDADLLAAFATEADFGTALALLTPAADVKALVPALATLLGDQLQAFLHAVVAKEVAAAADAPSTDLFRANSPAMRLLSEFAYFVGTAYFSDTLHAPLETLYAGTESYEVNDSVPAAEVAANRARLEAVAQMLLDRLLATAAPLPLARLCLSFRRSVALQFHTRTDAALGGFIFLRVLCPAVVAPTKVGLFPGRAMPPTTRRATVLVAKLLQNLANNVLFGAKEPYMTPFNGFVRRNYTAVVALYDRLCATAADALPPTAVPSPLSPSAALQVVRGEMAKRGERSTALLMAGTEPSVLMSAPLERASATSRRNVRAAPLSRTLGAFVARSSHFFMTSRGEGSAEAAVPWREAKARMGAANAADIRTRHSQYLDWIQRGIAYLAQASVDADGWRLLQRKHGVQAETRDRHGITELREVEFVDHTTRVTYRSAPAGPWPFAGAGRDVVLLESACCADDRPATVLFQSVRRADVPPVQGCRRLELRASGFVVRAEAAAVVVAAVFRFDSAAGGDWRKQLWALARLKTELEM